MLSRRKNLPFSKTPHQTSEGMVSEDPETVDFNWNAWRLLRRTDGHRTVLDSPRTTWIIAASGKDSHLALLPQFIPTWLFWL